MMDKIQCPQNLSWRGIVPSKGKQGCTLGVLYIYSSIYLPMYLFVIAWEETRGHVRDIFHFGRL